MGTQFDLYKRTKLEMLIRAGKSYKYIGRELGMDATSVKREIERNRTATNTKPFYGNINDCARAKTCQMRHVCGDGLCRRKCSACSAACDEGKCQQFVRATCLKRDVYPLVCNGCNKQRTCTLTKIRYDAKKAELTAHNRLIEARQGLNISTDELEHMAKIVRPGLAKGQSINHIMASNPNDFTVCQRTFYRYVNSGVMGVKRHDLPCAMKFKLRPKPVEHKVLRNCDIGRTMNDFKTFLNENPGTEYVEMDTVEGPRACSRKVLLTFQFPALGFMIARILERKTAANVVKAIDEIYMMLGKELFLRMFPVILTDKGTEFTNPVMIETAPDGSMRTHVYYCNAYRATDKPHIERNHEHIRKAIPKGTSFDRATQADIDRIMSNINSYRRPVLLGNRTPYERFVFEFGKDAADRIGILEVPANEVTIVPAFFG